MVSSKFYILLALRDRAWFVVLFRMLRKNIVDTLLVVDIVFRFPLHGLWSCNLFSSIDLKLKHVDNLCVGFLSMFPT